ncbi:MAG: hypothetical protein J6W96_03170 [Alphaproteobacteria bacterium]|nr:hypothetical protein [Alphaproteobacteria bacterium]
MKKINWKLWLINLGMCASPLTVSAQRNLAESDSAESILSSRLIAERTDSSIDNSSTTKLTKRELAQQKAQADSAAKAWAELSAREKLRSCSDQMLLFLTQFEDVRAKAYWDRVGGQVTAGTGFTHIDGKKINRNFKFKNMEALTKTWRNELERKDSWFDTMEAYLGQTIDMMQPQNEKELLKCKSELCGWQSFLWQNGPGCLGSCNQPSKMVEAAHRAQQSGTAKDREVFDSLYSKHASPLVKAYTTFCQTGDSIYYRKTETLFKAWNKVTKRDAAGNPIKDRNGNPIKVVLPSSTARRTAEFDQIRGACITTVGPRPEYLKKDTTTQYMDILDVVVGGIHSVRDRQTGAVPNNWPQLVQETRGDTITTRYQREFPELKQAPANDNQKKEPEEPNPILRFFKSLREL